MRTRPHSKYLRKIFSVTSAKMQQKGPYFRKGPMNDSKSEFHVKNPKKICEKNNI